jgi:hypothetical protein
MTHHSVMSYQERLATYIEKLARSSSRNLSTSLDHYQEQASRNMTSLFAPPPMPESQGLNGGLDRAALDDMGNALGGAAQVIFGSHLYKQPSMMVYCMHGCHCHISCFCLSGVLQTRVICPPPPIHPKNAG